MPSGLTIALSKSNSDSAANETFFPIGPSTREYFGENNYLGASDFPHTDSTWPNSLEVIKKDFAKVPPEVTQKIVFDNAVKLYRMA